MEEGEQPQKELHVEITNDLERRVADAFCVFDHAGNKSVDVREIGTILRALGCVPTEAEVQDIILRTEDRDCSGIIHLANFLPYVCELINDHKMQAATPEKLLEAFKVLDKDNKGFLDRAYLTKLVTQECEPLIQEELEEMMVAAVDAATDTIPYEYYINQLMVEPEQ